jgi:hypothetical protein
VILLFKVAMAEDMPRMVGDVLASGWIGQGPKVEEAFTRLELDWLACRPGEVGERLARLADPAVRGEASRIGFEHMWANYRPERCASLFASVLDAARVQAT